MVTQIIPSRRVWLSSMDVRNLIEYTYDEGYEGGPEFVLSALDEIPGVQNMKGDD